MTLLDVKNERSRRVFTWIALTVFVAGLGIAMSRVGGEVDLQLQGSMFLSMLGLLCLTFLINVLRTHTHSRIVAANLSLTDNARISLLGSAMNMLPMLLPAGTVMRMSNLIRHGGKAQAVFGLMASNYLLALATSLLLGIGLLFLKGDERLYIWSLSLVGVYALSLLLFLRLAGVRAGMSIALLESAGVVIDAVRLLLCFAILGTPVLIHQTTLLTASAVIGSTVSVVPAGLGVREIAGALLAPLAALSPGQSYLAIALNRIFGMLFFAGLAALLLSIERRRTA